MTKQLKEDYQYCRQIIRKNSESFYTAFSTLPNEKARSVYAIYAFCRKADNAVDLSTDLEQSKIELERMEDLLNRVFAGQEVESAGWPALKDTIQRWQLPKAPFIDQLRGQAIDLEIRRFETIDQLTEYCDLVAGSVGRMLLPILAVDNWPTLAKAGSELGIAMQLTNILRDIGEDLIQRDRIYLPMEWMKKYQVRESDLRQGMVTAGFVRLWEELRAKADRLYQSFMEQILAFDKEVQLPLYTAAYLYRSIHQTVIDARYDCLTTRNFNDPKAILRLIGQAKNDLKYLSQGRTTNFEY